LQLIIILGISIALYKGKYNEKEIKMKNLQDIKEMISLARSQKLMKEENIYVMQNNKTDEIILCGNSESLKLDKKIYSLIDVA
jgi:hypothetical protein